jgi:hypothetical protein
MTNKLLLKNSHQAIAAINNSIIPEHIKSKLKTIAKKIHHLVILSQEENIFWNSFANCGKYYILPGDF